MWNRLRYTVWAPAYDAIVRAAGFDGARRLSIERLRLAHVTPAMLKHLERRAAGPGRSVTARSMDARQLAFPDSSFDAIVMHLVLAVMPQPERSPTSEPRFRIVRETYGPPEVLHLEEVPLPTVGDCDVLVRVEGSIR